MKVKATTQIYTNSRLLWSLTHLCPAPEWVGWANSETKRFRRLRRVIGVVLPRIEGLCSQSPHSSPIFLSPSRTWNTHQTAISVLETACSRNFPEIWLVRGQLLCDSPGTGYFGKYSPRQVGAKYSRPIRAGQCGSRTLEERSLSAGRGQFLSCTNKSPFARCEQTKDPKDV